jgi:hypothetical protein
MNASGALTHTPHAPSRDGSLSKAFIVTGIATYLLACAFLAIFLPPLPILAHLLVLAGIYTAWRWPVGLIAIILLVAPFQPLPTLALQASGHQWVVALSAFKEIGMLCAAGVLAWRSRLKLGMLDLMLVALVGWAVLISLMHADAFTWIGLKDDFDFVIPFYAGRLILLNKTWIRSGLWIASVVAVLGLIEFFWIGLAPRMLLLGLSDTATLASSYTATGFSGFRAASTVSGPLEFGALCAVALLCFASYYRELSWKYLVPAALLAGGLIVSITRMAWLAVLVGLIVIAVRTGQRVRLLSLVGISAFAMLLVIVPTLGLQDFIAATQNGYDPSEQGHVSDLQDKILFVLSHPLGVGAGVVGPRALDRDSKALHVESAYLQIGMAYGWPGILLFPAFLIGIVMKLWKNTSDIGIAGTAVAFGLFLMYFFSPIHSAFEVNSWAWALIGCGVGGGVDLAQSWRWETPC